MLTSLSAISDAYGRRLVLISTLVVFFSACIGLALIKHYYQLVILRCLQSTGSASTIAIGSGIIGDVTDRKERGSYMGFFQTGLLLPLGEYKHLRRNGRSEYMLIISSYWTCFRWYFCSNIRLAGHLLVFCHLRRDIPYNSGNISARDSGTYSRRRCYLPSCSVPDAFGAFLSFERQNTTPCNFSRTHTTGLDSPFAHSLCT